MLQRELKEAREEKIKLKIERELEIFEKLGAMIKVNDYESNAFEASKKLEIRKKIPNEIGKRFLDEIKKLSKESEKII